MKSIIETKEFNNLKCIDCEYQDLKPCISCVPQYSYDLQMQSKIRKQDIMAMQTSLKTVQ